MSIYQSSAYLAAKELVAAAKLKRGDILVVGCSTSEVLGAKIGTHSVPEVAKQIVQGILEAVEPYGVFVAGQCCEHLNRAIILEAEAAEKYGYEPVNVIPQPKAGGSFATALYHALGEPVAVEQIKAACGMDIGDTLIGMHLKEVAVPVRLSLRKIGEANVVCARTRPKFIGGVRAVYDESKM